MKIVSYNVQFGVGRDGKLDCKRIADEIRGADIIALQEVTRQFFQNGNIDMVSIFQDFFPDFFVAFGPACDVDAGSSVENGKSISRRFQFGNMILSRYPILTVRHLLLPRSRTFDRLNMQRSALEALILTPNGPLRIYSTHLDHRSPDERISQIQFLKDRVINYALEGGALTGASEFGLPEIPHTDDYVVLGDFNMTPESPEYIAMCGLKDTYLGRTMRATAPVDALAHFGKLSSSDISWIDVSGQSADAMLDYIFVSPGISSRVKDSGLIRDAKGSDHLPIWIELK